MAMEEITLTICLPHVVWQELGQEAQVLGWSLDRVAVELIQWGLRQRSTLCQERLEGLQAEHQLFLESPLGQYVLEHTNPQVTLEQVLAITSKDHGSWATEVSAEREERL